MPRYSEVQSLSQPVKGVSMNLHMILHVMLSLSETCGSSQVFVVFLWSELEYSHTWKAFLWITLMRYTSVENDKSGKTARSPTS